MRTFNPPELHDLGWQSCGQIARVVERDTVGSCHRSCISESEDRNPIPPFGHSSSGWVQAIDLVASPSRRLTALGNYARWLLLAVQSQRALGKEGRRCGALLTLRPEGQLTEVLPPLATKPWPAPDGRVEMWRGGGRSGIAVDRPFRLAVP